MDFPTQAQWDRQLFSYNNNSMMAPQADQHPESPSFPVDDPLHWPVNLDPYLRTPSHLEPQEWAAQMQAKTFTSMQNQSLNQNHNQGNQNQQQYSSYQEAHSQTTYPAAAPQLLTSNLPYATPSASFATTTHWAPSPGADSGDSTVLSPRSERDFRNDMSPYGGGLPLERSQSGISALSHLSHESAAELWPASAAAAGNGGQPQFHPQTTGSLAMINPELGEEEAPVFGGEVLSFRDEDMFMDREGGEMEGGGLHTLAPRPLANSQFLHPHSPGPSQHHRHHHHTSPSPAPSAYSTHSTHNNNQAPRLTPHHNHYVEEDTDMDNDVDIDSPLPIPDDNDTDDSYSPTTRRPRASKKRTTTTRRPNPPSVLHSTSNARVTKQRRSNPSSTSGSRNGRSNGATPTFPCTFAWAGCPSAFATKNEWKRHVASKHTCFFYYECRIGSCSAPGQSGSFNRKDLFAQHLRRMHAPSASSLAKGGAAAKEEWDEKLKGYLAGGYRVGRAAIKAIGCPLSGCGANWDGQRPWEERMEHVARHWEEGKVMDEGGGGVEEWAVREGVVRRGEGGGWVLVEGGVGEADAVGEEE